MADDGRAIPAGGVQPPAGAVDEARQDRTSDMDGDRHDRDAMTLDRHRRPWNPEPSRDRAPRRPGPGRAPGAPAQVPIPGALMLDPADLQALFQPIGSLSTGAVEGFETLARLKVQDRLLPPSAFLPGLRGPASMTLLAEMLRQAGDMLAALPPGHETCFVSVNVEASVLVMDGFMDVVLGFHGRHAGLGCGRLVLEIVESQAIDDTRRVRERLTMLRALGTRVALDDLGSAYASLNNLRDLPADIIKLEHGFASHLRERPKDLALILSLQGLATNLGKHLVVEGIEDGDVYDALRVLGVDLGQGFFIAEPMALDRLVSWLGEAAPPRPAAPDSLLGAYAGHLRVTEACRVLTQQLLPIAWTEAARNPHACTVGGFLDRRGLHDTEVGRAHKRFHEGLGLCHADRSAWQAGAEDFRLALEAAIAGHGAPRRSCDAV